MTEAQAKLKLFALLKDKSKDSSIDTEMRSLTRETKIPYPKLRRWKKEFDDDITAAEIDTIVNTPVEIIAKVAKQVVEDSIEETFEALPEDFMAKQDSKALEDYKEGKVEDFTQKAVDLTKLNQNVLNEADNLVKLIAKKIARIQVPIDKGGDPMDYLDSKTVNNLTSALCSLQQAFFNKQTGVALAVKGNGDMMALFTSNLEN